LKENDIKNNTDYHILVKYHFETLFVSEIRHEAVSPGETFLFPGEGPPDLVTITSEFWRLNHPDSTIMDEYQQAFVEKNFPIGKLAKWKKDDTGRKGPHVISNLLKEFILSLDDNVLLWNINPSFSKEEMETSLGK